MSLRSLLSFVFSTASFTLFAQGVNIEGYTYASNNSGYISQADITVSLDGVDMPDQLATDETGKFVIQVPAEKVYIITANKAGFRPQTDTVSTVGKANGESVYLKFPMTRLPGYILEGTLAEAMVEKAIATDSLKGPGSNSIEGAIIEFYNNTTHKEELRLVDHPYHTFNFRLEQGNEYTMLIRKKGYYNKRAKIKVNIKGCILCFEGVGTITPGVVENLTNNNTMGTLGANINLKKIEIGKGIKLDNIYYDTNKDEIRADAKPALDNLVRIMKENPQVVIELRSHTDSRNSSAYNMELSQRRAEGAVSYIESKGIALDRIKGKGFGETTLVNKCTDGVVCSEEQHQENRRTEFAVVDFLADPYEGRSLKSIMAEEEMDEILRSNESQYFEAPANTTDTKMGKADSMATEIKAQELAKAPILKTANVEFNEGIDSSKSVVPAISNIAVSDKPSIDTPKTEIAPVPNKKDSSVATQVDAENKENSLLLERAVKKIPYDYTGFLIELVMLDANITKDNPILKSFGKIYHDYTNDSTHHSYMIGEFNKKVHAETYLIQNIITRYPNARIIQYEKGIRLEK